MTRCGPVRACLALLAGLLFVPAVDAQLPFRLFGPKLDKAQPGKTNPPDLQRAAEVNVEIAWLADPITFPYYLEAHVNGSQLEVRGFVPNKTIRDQAIRIAQVFSSMPVTDAMKEHPSLLVRPSTLAPEKLQASVLSSLKVALPKQYAALKINCGKDGKVNVAGPVDSVDEKVAVSHALRRLHGCTSVQNLTTLPAEYTPNMPVIRTSNVVDPMGEKPADTKEPPGHEPPRPALPLIGLPDGKTANADAGPRTTDLLKDKIRAACPNVRGVVIEFLTAQAVRLTIEIGSEKEVTATAERILVLPELQNHRADLLFKISSP